MKKPSKSKVNAKGSPAKSDFKSAAPKPAKKPLKKAGRGR